MIWVCRSALGCFLCKVGKDPYNIVKARSPPCYTWIGSLNDESHDSSNDNVGEEQREVPSESGGNSNSNQASAASKADLSLQEVQPSPPRVPEEDLLDSSVPVEQFNLGKNERTAFPTLFML